MARGLVRLQGTEELKKNSFMLQVALSAVNRNTVIEEAEKLQRVMAAKAPERTGLLARSITTRIWKDKEGVTGVVVGVEGGHPEFYGGKGYYPASQEYGWEYPKGVHHPPHPYVRPAFDENKNGIRNKLKKEYKGVIERAGR